MPKQVSDEHLRAHLRDLEADGIAITYASLEATGHDPRLYYTALGIRGIKTLKQMVHTRALPLDPDEVVPLKYQMHDWADLVVPEESGGQGVFEDGQVTLSGEELLGALFTKSPTYMPQTRERFLIYTDVHGQDADMDVIECISDFADVWKPDVTICMGDLWDMAPLRSKCKTSVKRQSILHDYSVGKRVLNMIHTDYLMCGNHEYRIFDLYRSADSERVREWIERYICDMYLMTQRTGIKIMPYDIHDGIMRLGKRAVLHGFNTGVNATKKTAEMFGDSICGHIHTNQSTPIHRWDCAVGDSIGCASRLDLSYTRNTAKYLRWQHGWGYGYVFPDGEVLLWKVKKKGGKFYAPQFEELR